MDDEKYPPGSIVRQIEELKKHWRELWAEVFKIWKIAEFIEWLEKQLNKMIGGKK